VREIQEAMRREDSGGYEKEIQEAMRRKFRRL
jgi:hypothetical protein